MATESHSVALGYAERNRGTFSFGGDDGNSSRNDKKESVASKLADRNREGTIGGVINSMGSDSSPKHTASKKNGPASSANTRCNTPDARKNAERNQGQGVRAVFGTPEENGDGSLTPRIKPEARANFEKHKGSLTMDMHDHSDSRPKGRVTASGKAYADRNLGTLGTADSEISQGATTKRVRGTEAGKNAESSQGSISEVFNHHASDCDVRSLKIS